MHRLTKATAIPDSVKERVRERDHGRCIICGAEGIPCCHIVRRSQMGMGVEENIVTLCSPCHYAFDEGLGMKRLKPLGLNTQQDVRDYIVDYIRGFYPGWTKEKVTYRKWKDENETD